MTYKAKWWVTCLTVKAALAHERRVLNLPEDIHLGWTPYRFRAEHGAVPHTAFHTIEELRRWIDREGFKIVRVSSHYIGCRTIFLEQRFTCADCGEESGPSHNCKHQAETNRRAWLEQTTESLIEKAERGKLK
jgi:hypothetical protein